jgi:hypothetical protein
MRRSALFVLAISLLLAGAGCSGNGVASSSTSSLTPKPSESATPSTSPTDSLPGLVFVNSQGGYTFHYDPGWVVRPQKAPTDVTVFAPPGTPARSPANVSLGAVPISSGTTLTQYFKQNIAFLRLIPGFSLIGTNQETLGGLPAFEIEYTAAPSGHPFKSLQVTAISGDVAFSAIYSSDPKRFSRYLIAAGLVVRSLSFNQ